jgi:hypothetical protein
MARLQEIYGGGLTSKAAAQPCQSDARSSAATAGTWDAPLEAKDVLRTVTANFRLKPAQDWGLLEDATPAMHTPTSYAPTPQAHSPRPMQPMFVWT